MWRPDNWDNPYLNAKVVDRERLVFRLPDNGIYIEGHGRDIGTNAFEAGADAMLVGLKPTFLALGIDISDKGIYYHTRSWEQYPNHN